MKNKISARKLKHKITFLTQNQEQANDWTIKFGVFSCASYIKPNISQLFDDAQFGNLINHTYMLFACRYHSDIDKSMRIEFQGNFFAIRKITNLDQKAQYIEIIAIQVA